jgi:hypothetical protein
VPPAPPAQRSYRFTGNLRTAGPVQVSAPVVQATSEGQQAVSTATVPLEGGALVLEQKLVDGPEGQHALLAPRIEQASSTTSVVPRVTSSSVSRGADGSVVVDLELTARSQAVVASSSGDQEVGWFRTLITYAPDLSTITSEIITTHEGRGPSATPPTSASDGPIGSDSAEVSDRQRFPTSKEAEGSP